MEIRELKAFQVVAKELNFRKAAEILGMSQPPLTRIIGNLEANLGVRLFHRTTRSVELTGEGIYLLHRSREIVEKIECLTKELRSLKKINKQTINVSLHHAAIHSEIPRLISSFKLQFPGININLVQVRGSQLEKKLLLGELDMAIGVLQPKSLQLSHLEINHQELGLLISNDNILSRKQCLKLSDLDGETLIFHGKDDHLGFQSEFARYLRKIKIKISIYYRKDGDSCSKLAAENRGILLTSRAMAMKSKGVKYVPFIDFSPKLKIYALWKRAELSDELKALLSFIEERQQVPGSDMDYHFN